MPEIVNSLKKCGIRCQMNMVYSLMRLLSSILDMAKESETARTTLTSVAENILNQAAELFNAVGQYASDLTNATEEKKESSQ